MKLKFLQWNVLYKEDMDKVVTEIKKSQADVITAQEFIIDKRRDIDTAKYVAEKLDFNYFYAKGDSWDNREDKEEQGNAIFSRFPITETNSTHVSPPKHNPENALEEGRVYTEAIIDVDGKRITVGTTHLSFTPHFEITSNRKEEADNLIKVINKKKNNYIFGADLNATPDSYVVSEFNKHLIDCGPDRSQNTFSRIPFDYRGLFQVKGIDWRIDFVFATPDLKILNAQVVPTNCSDHLPILIEIEL